MYPNYKSDIKVQKSAMKLTATLTAKTRCGPNISASHTVRLRTLTQAEIVSAGTLAVSVAARELAHDHTEVEIRCIRAGTHHH